MRRIRFFGAELTRAQAERLLECVRERFPALALYDQDLGALNEELAADEWLRWTDSETRMDKMERCLFTRQPFLPSSPPITSVCLLTCFCFCVPAVTIGRQYTVGNSAGK